MSLVSHYKLSSLLVFPSLSSMLVPRFFFYKFCKFVSLFFFFLFGIEFIECCTEISLQ